ncbi:uncharacterized protein SPPG_04848 [Spizellomyces punctatus DAOM BR117]|uniref:Alpha/beta hydrolase fold-3 domain-containing protein n=1 Tax=Spizellomyces punctatus (strain DAOM BR117) TaxID=645134 RepID=A0A0L0HI43_SPIPD|nr:uncharacterized protein SPPG_04848 [Spizellomyces punctatus DAOM BR117]KND00540.1 hypothetical protein SPPG_04848 [Spizellomyces punctatus DAOM BR117]|eukprot:XP_016608579.1 hypothetical protein SPPG_04848 [Spizellomyces punctatus DAOM BR117]
MSNDTEVEDSLTPIDAPTIPASPPPTRTERLRVLLTILPLVASTTLKHLTIGPPYPTWPLKLHLIQQLVRNATEISMKKAAKGHDPQSPLSKETLVRRAVASRTRGETLLTQMKLDPKRVDIRPWSLDRTIVDRSVWTTRTELDGCLSWEGVLEGEWVQWIGSGARDSGGVVLYLHGGAYYMLSPRTHRMTTSRISRVTGCRVLAIDYRLAPEYAYPAALHDAVMAYHHLTHDLHIPPSKILVMGDSAGGGLTMSLLVWLKQFGAKESLPGGAAMFSPWLDLSNTSGPSWTDAKFDYLPPQTTVPPTDPYNPAIMYAGGRDLYDPIMSPLWADPEILQGLPPILIQSGSIECLASDSIALSRILPPRNATIQLYTGMPHVFVAFPFLNETRAAYSELDRFVADVLSGRFVGRGLVWVGRKGPWEERIELSSGIKAKL